MQPFMEVSGIWILNLNYQIGLEFNSITISGWKWYGADICDIFAIYKKTIPTSMSKDTLNA